MDDKTIGILIGGLIGGFFTILGALVNGYISRKNLFAQLQHQQRKEEINRRLEKLENLHELISDYIVSTYSYVSGVLLLRHSGKVVEGFTNVSDHLLHPLPKISSKLKIYAPELEKCWIDLAKTARQLFIVASDYLTQPNKNDSEIHKLNETINKNCQNLMKEIVKVIQATISENKTNNKTEV